MKKKQDRKKYNFQNTINRKILLEGSTLEKRLDKKSLQEMEEYLKMLAEDSKMTDAEKDNHNPCYPKH